MIRESFQTIQNNLDNAVNTWKASLNELKYQFCMTQIFTE